MSAEENKAKVCRIYDECFNQGNLATADELVAPDARDLSPGALPGIPTTGAQTLKAIVPLLRTAFPDLRVTADEIIAEGDVVAARTTWTGTHHGAFMGIPPTGQPVSWSSLELIHFREGQSVSRFGLLDTLSLMHQLGAIPSAGPSGG